MDVTVLPTHKKFTPVYSQGEPGSGIGGYDLKSANDLAFPFDYDSSGKLDHIVLYRPGTGTCWILKNEAGKFSAVYHQGDPGSGIGGYDLKSTADRLFAFDYDHSGKLDHLVCYRPGRGTCWILKRMGATFTAVFNQGDPGNGIGGYDLKSTDDQMFALDYDHSGKLDHLCLYRPGRGTFWILKNSGGVFSTVFNVGDPGHGIGGYDLSSRNDRAFAFDWDSNGKMDHIVLYRPGTGTFWCLRNDGGAWKAIVHEGDPGHGIGGYDLRSTADVAFAFDWDHSGKNDHVALYRPGTGTFWVLARKNDSFVPVFNVGDPGNGVGGYDLKSKTDKLFSMDYDHSGKQDYLVAYRTNSSGTIWIMKHD
ncbi:hypothetical protein BX600DRAFT_389652 [Xylariales sp. PMI_506]|nr:hypothetical protein BX600DRAFT_389652 [Xylariales sp. PMI_506]